MLRWAPEQLEAGDCSSNLERLREDHDDGD